MRRWSEFLDLQVERHRARRDPLARLPWWLSALLGVLLVVFGIAQVLLGAGLSKALGLALLVFVAPSQLLSAWAAKQVQDEQR